MNKVGTESEAASLTAGGDAGKEYLTFNLGGETYAVHILQVQEIRGYEEPTRIATAPPYLKGVVNLRGAIVPIVDLRIKLNLGNPTYDSTTAVIIARANNKTTGFVVDSVTDVISFSAEQLRPTPDIASSAANMAMAGLAISGDSTFILVDLEKLVPSESAQA